MPRRISTVVAVLVAMSVSAAAAYAAAGTWAAPTRADGASHPGHGTKAVVGTLREVTRAAIVIEVLDSGTGGLTRVRVQLQRDTRMRLDKEILPSLEPFIGHRVSATVDWEDDDRGGQTMMATEVKVARARRQ